LSTWAPRIATAFFCKSKRRLDKGLDLPDTLPGLLSPDIGHYRAGH